MRVRYFLYGVVAVLTVEALLLVWLLVAPDPALAR